MNLSISIYLDLHFDLLLLISINYSQTLNAPIYILVHINNCNNSVL